MNTKNLLLPLFT